MAKKKKKSNKTAILVLATVAVVLLVAAVVVCLTVEKVRTSLSKMVYAWLNAAEQSQNANHNNGGNQAIDQNTTPSDNGDTTPSTPTDNTPTDNTSEPTQHGDISTYVGVPTLSGEEFSIHFFELGNKYTGDSTFLKIGDVDILIDAGSRTSSSATIVNYVSQYCTDGKLDYVIATHAHQDHIAGFVGSKANPGVFDSFEIGTIIEFAGHNTDSGVYNNYVSERDEAVARGATLYTALQCYNQTDGASRVYTLAEGVRMEILYNYYYDHTTTDENDYSVCTLFTVGDKHFLFTGDLEKKGEEYLVQYNDLPQVELFKGGHHGSYTANTQALLEVIRPKVVCVCCCLGTPEYTDNPDNMFPSQAFFDHVLPYTDLIFVPSLSVWDDVDTKNYSVASLNGNIVVLASSMDIYCSANDTPVPQTEWFEKHRKRPKEAQ